NNMNNEIGRKITSLTLMTIMLAGGMVIAAPSMMPVAHAANANLFVSAENSQFDNYMSGPQVIEVVVIDSDIDDTDQAKGEPDVTINGKILRMVQAVDGNWYGYFADRQQASIADFTTSFKGQGIDFGTLCATGTTTNAFVGVSVDDTVGIAVPLGNMSAGAGALSNAPGENGTATGAALTVQCVLSNGQQSGLAQQGNTTGHANVLRESKTPNTTLTGADQIGQIGISDVDVWPFVQLYALNPTGNVVVQYNKGGGVQSTTLTFDTVDNFASASLDRSVYTRDAQVHVTVTDLWLNIDPTDEDSWTFGTNATFNPAHVGKTGASGTTTNYQVFNENGAVAGAGTAHGIIDISGNLTSMMIESNGVLILNADAQSSGTSVLRLQDTDDTVVATCTTNDASLCVATNTALLGLGENTQPITITEQGPNSGVFGTYDESDNSVILVTSTALRGTSATLDYNETPTTVLVGFDFGTVDIQPTDDEWNSGEEISVILTDGDANLNSRSDEDLDLNNPAITLIPSLVTGDPFTLRENSTGIEVSFIDATIDGSTTVVTARAGFTQAATVNVTSFSDIARIDVSQNAGATNSGGLDSIVIDLQTTMGELRSSIGNTDTGATDRLRGFNLLNLDVRSFNATGTFNVFVLNATGVPILHPVTGALNAGVGSLNIAAGVNPQSLTNINGTNTNGTNIATALFDTTAGTGAPDANQVGLLIQHVADTTSNFEVADAIKPIAVDFFSFGFISDGLEASQRVSNQIIRIEAEETGDNTSTFAGTLEYKMINQLNVLDATTYTGLSTIASDPTFIVVEDLTDEDAPRVNYLDLGADGVSTQIADQEEAPSHSGVVSFDSNNYKNADTVTITLEDLDLNVDSDLIDIYTTVTTTGDQNTDSIGSGNGTTGGTSITLSNGDELGRLLDVTFDDERWITPSNACLADLVTEIGDGTVGGGGDGDTGLGATGFTLVETGAATGVFTGDFQIPTAWCKSGATSSITATGLDIEVNYVDYRDASGETIEVGDSAGVRANTGSISLDRTVYPVPFGVESDFIADTINESPSGRALFPIHASGMNTAGTTRATEGLQTGEFITGGDLLIHVRVNDPDFDISASGEDTISSNSTSKVGPVKVSVIRGSSSIILGYAGGDSVLAGTIDTDGSDVNATRAFGPMTEIAPDAGIFESDITIRYTDGPASSKCSSVTDTWTNLDGAGTAETDRFDVASTSGDYCILQGDILQVEYTDPADASGSLNTVTDSATFDLRNGVLQSDKSVYIIGSDMILTLIEPDFDLDNDQAETYDLDLIEWDSDAATITMGDADGADASFDPEPLSFRETGDSTGIFQIVIEIPEVLEGDRLERGEETVLEYTDWGPSGSDYVGEEEEDVNVTVFTSNFGATVELDQKVYTWTDKVYITIVAPDHNFDGDLIDEIGETSLDPIKVATRGFNID
ncbi:MAG: hypothetical protein HOL71_03830, partial [Euryarchaeota archaeon]|nr:hypothetical protein [Euryarchaeota archaeon]